MSVAGSKMQIGQYTHLLVVGAVASTLTAYSIGANDEANFFGAAVGANVLTMRQAFVMCLFGEIIGGVFLGSEVADAVIGRVYDSSIFASRPELLMLGYTTALLGTGFWLLFATKMGWPVSTGHSIVGSMIGLGVAAFGVETLDSSWNGLGKVMASWFAAPAISCMMGASVYMLNKHFVLSRRDCLTWGLSVVPIYVFFTGTMAILFLILKSGKSAALVETSLAAILLGSFGAGIFAGGISYIFLVPWLRRRLIAEESLKWYHVFYHFAVPTQPKDEGLKAYLETFREHGAKNFRKGGLEGEEEVVVVRRKKKTFLQKWFPAMYVDVYSVKDTKTAEIHNAAEKLDPKTEYLFIGPQLFTACVLVFAHGSNDIQNAMGPLTGIYNIWNTAVITESFRIPPLAMLYGACLLIVGATTFGHIIFNSLGNSLIYHSPARCFAISTGVLITVFIGAYIGIPALSLTHSTIGASAGVGLVGAGTKGINKRALAWYFFAGLSTDAVCAIVTGSLFGFVTKSPH